MRAVKTVISAAGNLKRENPEMNEVIVVLMLTLCLPINLTVCHLCISMQVNATLLIYVTILCFTNINHQSDKQK